MRSPRANYRASGAGRRGAILLRRETAAGVEFLALSFRESLASVQAFADADVETAVVDPAAQAVLTDFDRFVRHYEVAAAVFPTAAAG